MPIVAKSKIAVAQVAAPVVRPDVLPRVRLRIVASAPDASATPNVHPRTGVDPAPSAGEPDTRPKLKPGDEDYVGKGHPPKKYRFKEGKSGNPKGRPKGAKGLKSIVREVMLEKVVAKTANGTRRMSKIEAMVRKKVARAFDDKPGSDRAAEGCEALFKWAVPDEPAVTAAACDRPLMPEEMSELDKATLAAFAKMIRETSGEGA